MSTYIIDRFRINKNGNRERCFYTGSGIDFNRDIQSAKVFKTLDRARESVKYLNDCNMTVYVIEIRDDNSQDIVYSPELEDEKHN